MRRKCLRSPLPSAPRLLPPPKPHQISPLSNPSPFPASPLSAVTILPSLAIQTSCITSPTAPTTASMSSPPKPTVVGRIGQGLFAGTRGGNNDIAGPNGITLGNSPQGTLLIAGNGPSNFLTFTLNGSGQSAVGAPRVTSTAVAGTPTPQNRVDGVAYAPTTNTILAANNASNPGFLTLVNNANGSVIRSIPLNGSGGYPNVGGARPPTTRATTPSSKQHAFSRAGRCWASSMRRLLDCKRFRSAPMTTR